MEDGDNDRGDSDVDAAADGAAPSSPAAYGQGTRAAVATRLVRTTGVPSASRTAAGGVYSPGGFMTSGRWAGKSKGINDQ